MTGTQQLESTERTSSACTRETRECEFRRKYGVSVGKEEGRFGKVLASDQGRGIKFKGRELASSGFTPHIYSRDVALYWIVEVETLAASR